MTTIAFIISGTIHPAVTAQPVNTTAPEHSPPNTLGVSAVNSGSHSDIEATDGTQSIHTQFLDSDLVSSQFGQSYLHTKTTSHHEQTFQTQTFNLKDANIFEISLNNLTDIYTEAAAIGTPNSIAQNVEEPVVHQSLWKWESVTWTWVTIPQITMSMLGIVGNLTVILVLFQRRHTCRSTDALIGALAVADFLTSVFMIPLPTALRVPGTWLGDVYCKIVYSEIFMWVSVDASIFILALIPLERYIAIAHPLHFKRLVTRQRVGKVIALTWLVAFLANLFLFSVAGARGDMCTVTFYSDLAQIMTGCMLYLVQFLIPAVIMLVAQALTALVLHQQSRRRIGEDLNCNNSNPSTKYLLARKSVLKILFLVVVVFLISWTPTQTAYLLYNLRVLPTSYLYSPLSSAFIVLAFCNSCANPVIYTIQNPAFRKAVGELFKSTTSALERTALFSEK
ncbi:trace amine-associated receptor 9-like [Diadema setosum]|uniref:trace amine-associated receptor 9-like n=1 Tax=Diadema setosum TaxID=31175 RepID=UPI003B3B4EC2